MKICLHCKINPVKRNRADYCSYECLYASKASGKWADKFWKKWLFEFDEKFSHLDRLDQLKMAFKQGQWTAYRKANRKDGKQTLSRPTQKDGRRSCRKKP